MKIESIMCVELCAAFRDCVYSHRDELKLLGDTATGTALLALALTLAAQIVGLGLDEDAAVETFRKTLKHVHKQVTECGARVELHNVT